MKLMDAVKMYGLDKNKEETAAGAFSSSASDGTKTVGAVSAGSALADRMEKYRAIRAGELESRLGSWQNAYNNFISEYNSGKKSTQEIRDAWDIVKADGEKLSAEIKSSSVFASSDADGVSDEINGYISSFDEQLKSPKRDIGSLGGLDTEYNLADEARKAAARSMATGAAGDEAADAKEALDFTSAPKFSQVGTHQSAVIGDDNYAAKVYEKIAELEKLRDERPNATSKIEINRQINNLRDSIALHKNYSDTEAKSAPQPVRALTDSEEKLAEGQNGGKMIYTGSNADTILHMANNAADFNNRVADDLSIAMDSASDEMDRAVSGIGDFVVGKAKGLYAMAHSLMETGSVTEAVKNFTEAENKYLKSGDSFLSKHENSIINQNLQARLNSGDLNTLERVAIDLAGTVGYQLPNMLLTGVTGAAGLAANLITVGTFGSSSYASTKREYLQKGYSDADAELLARGAFVIEGVGETLLGDAFGVAPMLGNKLGISVVSNIQNPIVRTMLKYLGESAEEGAEEVVQSFLSEAWKSFVFGEDFTLDGKEIMYEGILGALSGGLLGSIGLRQRIAAAERIHAADVDYINTLSVNADTIENARDAQIALRALERQRAALGQISDDGAGVRSAAERAEYMDGMMHEIEVQLAERFSLDDDITAAGVFKKNKNGIGLKRSVSQEMSVQGTDDNRVIDFEARAAAVTDADGAAQIIYEIEKYRAERADYSENYETDAQREKYARYDSRLAGIAEELRDRFGVEGTYIAPAGEATMQGVSSKEELDKAFSPDARAARASGEELETAAQTYSAPDTEDARFVMQTGKENGATPGDIAAAQELNRILGRRIGFYSSDPDDNGYYDRANNRIMVNAASGRTVPSVVASEMTHALELTEQYGELKKIALENLPKAKGETLEALRERKRLTYESRGEVLSPEDVDRELTEEYVGKYLFDTVGQIRSAVSKSSKLGLRVRQFLGAVARRIKPDSAVARLILSDVEYARKLWGDAAKAVGMSGESKSGTKHSYGDGDKDILYISAVERGDMETAQRMVDEAARDSGFVPVERFHQTSKRFTVFNTDNPVAGLNDSETPNGIFFKTNNHDIGIGGDIQMSCYLNIGKSLYFPNRKYANKWYCENVPGYNDLQNEWNNIYETEYQPKFDAIEEEQFNENTTDERQEELSDIEDGLISELGIAENSYRGRMRELLNQYFLKGDSGYDSIELAYDGHRWVNGNREDVHTYIVFSSSQAKSSAPVTYDDDGNIIPLSERFRINNPDVRHSYEDDIDRTIDKWSREANETLDQTDERKADERKEYSPDNGKRKFITSADLAEAGELVPPARSGERRASSAQAVSGENESYGDGNVPEGEYGMSRGEGYVSAAEEYASREESELSDMEAARGTLEERYPDMFKKPEVTDEFDPAEPAPGTARAVGQEAAKKLYGDKVSEKKLAAETERLSDEAFAIKVSDTLRAMQEGHIYYAENEEDLQRSLGHVADLIARTVTEEGISVQEQMLAQDIASGVKDVTHIPSDWDREQITALAELYAAKDNLEKKNPVSSPLEKLGFHVEYPLVTDYRKASSLRGWENARRDAVRIADKLMENLTDKEKKAANEIASGLFTIDDYQTAGIDHAAVSLAADALTTAQSFDEGGVRAQGASTREAFMKVLNALVENPEHAKRRLNAELVSQTMVRNNLNVFGNVIGAKVNEVLFKPIIRNEAERMRFVNREVQEFSDIFMKDGKKISEEESACIQLFIEAGIGAEELAGQDTEALFKRFADTLNSARADYEELGKVKRKDRKTKKLIYAAEKTINENTMKHNALAEAIDKGLDIMRVAAEADWFRQKYALYYDAINDFLVSHGYRPIGFIKNYAPHMQEENMSKLSKALSRLGFGEHVFELPVDIAGRTDTFKPGKKYNPYFQTRHGTSTKLDALSGFDSYLQHLSEVLYHTDDIQKLRLFNQYLRTSMASEEIQKEVNEWRGKMARGEVDTEDGNNAIDRILEEKVKNTNLSPYVTILDDYTNVIAGKQTRNDRSTESTLGRGALNAGNAIKKWFVQASIVGNISSAINQTVQLPMVMAECGEVNVAKAIWDVGSGNLNGKMDFDKRSVFITGKRGTNQLAELTKWDKAIEKGMIVFEGVDDIASRIIVRAKYFQLIDQGVDSDTALVLADEYADSVVGSRMKGAKPLIFNDKKPITSLVTMFQLEIANGWAHIVQDIPRDIKRIAQTQGKKAAAKYTAALLIRQLIYAFILDRLLYELFGQTPVQFDPIGWVLSGVSGGYGMTEGELFRYVLKNRKLPEEFDTLDFLKETGSEIVEDIPYVSAISAMFGFTDSRLPMPHLETTKIASGISNIASGDDDKRDKGTKQLIDGIWSSAKTIIPLGNQINKTIKGIRSVAQGGSYDYSGRLQYPVRNDVAGAIANIPAYLFGTQAFNESGEFWAEGGKALSEDATAAYEALVDTGMDFREAFDLVKEMSALKGDEKEKPEIDTSGMDPFEAMSALFFSSEPGGDDGLQSKVEKQIGLLNSTEGLTGEQKYLAFKHLSASDKVAEMMNYLADNGADPEIAYGVISELQLVEDTDEEPRARAEVLRESELTGWEKSFVYYSSLASKSEREIYDALRELNEGEPVIYETVDAYTTETKKGGEGAAERARAVIMDSDLSDVGKLKMYSMKCVSSSESGEKEQALIDELVAGGADEGEVAEVFSGIKDGEKDTDKVRALLDSDLTNLEIEKVYLQRIVSESSREKTKEKIERVIDAGGNIEIYLEAYIAVSGLSWENGDWKKKESLGKSKAYKKAIDNLTSRTPNKDRVRRALYDVFDVSEKLW